MKKLIEQLEKIIKDAKARVELNVPEEYNLSEVKFQMDCLLNYKVSEGRK
jgi:hypothetical protein